MNVSSAVADWLADLQLLHDAGLKEGSVVYIVVPQAWAASGGCSSTRPQHGLALARPPART